jgi:hypothetical protein
MKWYESINKRQIIAVTLIVLTVQFFFTLSAQPTVNDPFHTGEFFASATHVALNEISNIQPIQIHGLNDILPALLAESIWGPDNHFLPTLTFYQLLKFISYGLLISATLLIGIKNKEQLLIFIAILLIGQNFVSFRDTLLLLCINVFLLLCLKKFNLRMSCILQILFGALMVFSIFWSFDRGIAGVIALGIASLIAAKRNKIFTLSILAFFVFIPIFNYSHDIFSITKYINNVLILVDGSSEWSYDLTSTTVILSLFAAFFNVAVIVFFCMLAKVKKVKNEDLEIGILLIVLSLFLLKIGTNRADLGHIYMSLWTPLLLLLVTLRDEVSMPKSNHILNYAVILTSGMLLFVLISTSFGYLFFDVFPFVSALVIASLLIALLKTQKSHNLNFIAAGFILLAVFPAAEILLRTFIKALNGESKWVLQLRSPPPNIELATDGVVWTSRLISKNNNSCVFDLSNNGIINALAKLPSCTIFIYPVYAAEKHENKLIEQLQQSGAKSIVYSSTYWSYSIDGRDMAARFPKLNEYILKTFENEVCNFGYCVRSLE